MIYSFINSHLAIAAKYGISLMVEETCNHMKYVNARNNEEWQSHMYCYKMRCNLHNVSSLAITLVIKTAQKHAACTSQTVHESNASLVAWRELIRFATPRVHTTR